MITGRLPFVLPTQETVKDDAECKEADGSKQKNDHTDDSGFHGRRFAVCEMRIREIYNWLVLARINMYLDNVGQSAVGTVDFLGGRAEFPNVIDIDHFELPNWPTS